MILTLYFAQDFVSGASIFTKAFRSYASWETWTADSIKK